MAAPVVAPSAHVAKEGDQMKAVEHLGVGMSDLLLVVAVGKRLQKVDDARRVETVEGMVP
jgi:hypothetical protein